MVSGDVTEMISQTIVLAVKYRTSMKTVPTEIPLRRTSGRAVLMGGLSIWRPELRRGYTQRAHDVPARFLAASGIKRPAVRSQA